MEKYTLNDLEALTGIKTDTIRVWERRYGILKPNLTGTGRRWYTGDDLTRLINISVLYANGLKISKLAKLGNAEISERVAEIAGAGRGAGDQITALVVAMNRLDEAAVNEVLLKSVISRGLEATFTDVVFPFLKKVGVMWHTGSAGIATEHFMSAVFRSRLISAIDALPAPGAEKGRKFMLFLPDSELHELGLLFCSYIIKREGHRVLYLGQATPLRAVREAADSWQPEFAVTGTLSGIAVGDAAEYLKGLAGLMPGCRIFAMGSLSVAAAEAGIQSVVPLASASGLSALLKEISLKVG